MRRGSLKLSSSTRGILKLSRRYVEDAVDRHHDKRPAGLVGGYIPQKYAMGQLSPAVAYIDDVYLHGGIKERIRKTGHPKNAGAMDCFPATFLQSHYCIVYSGIYPRHPQNAQAKNAEKSDEKKSWPNLEFDRVKNCVGRGVHSLQKHGVSEIFVDPFNNAEAAAEAAFLAAYSFDHLKNPRKRVHKPPISCFTGHLDNDPDSFETRSKILEAWNRGRILAQCQNQARQWMEMPANLLPPRIFAQEMEEAFSRVAAATSTGDIVLTMAVHGKEWIEQHKMGGVIGVAQGSAQSPFFVEINYVGDKSRPDDHIALVGKGVTFDAGGISLKPSAGMDSMRADMGGAAVIASTLLGLAQLRSPINIRAYIPLVENMPDGNAIRPGDVLTMASGTTVQVDNTDAEGRLILADALHYAQNNPNTPAPPLFILDCATLTGAILTSLGDVYTGLFCNSIVQYRRTAHIWPTSAQENERAVAASPSIIGSLNFCGRTKNDPFWHMPSLYGKNLSDGCQLADLSNITTGGYAKLGGSGSAASFLQNFVSQRIPYVHLDIAGVMKTVSEDACMRRGMTGRPTRPLIHFFDRLARRNVHDKSAACENEEEAIH